MAYVDDKTKQYFLSLKPEELGIKKQTQLFARSVDPKTKKILPRSDVLIESGSTVNPSGNSKPKSA